MFCKIDQALYPTTTLNSWYGDSCVTCTINNNDLGVFDFRKVFKKFTGIGGKPVTVWKVGKKKVLFVQANGKVIEYILSSVKHYPNAKHGSYTSRARYQRKEHNCLATIQTVLTYPDCNEIIFDFF